MIVGQEVMKKTNSPTFCWSTNKGSFSTDVLFIRQVPDTILVRFFFQNRLRTAANLCGPPVVRLPQFDKHCLGERERECEKDISVN
jgi:hypothetical protein